MCFLGTRYKCRQGKTVEDLIFELQMMQFDGMIEDMRDCVEDIK